MSVLVELGRNERRFITTLIVRAERRRAYQAEMITRDLTGSNGEATKSASDVFRMLDVNVVAVRRKKSLLVTALSS